MRNKSVQEYYDSISLEYDKRRFRTRYHRNVAKKEEAFVASHVEGKTLLEIGPGTGRFTRRVVAEDRIVTVCDLSEQMLDRLRDNLGNVPNITYYKMSIEELSKLKDFGNYDTVIAMRVIPHVGNWRDAIETLRSAVRSGGVIIFDLWNNDSFVGIVRKLFRRRSKVLTHRLRRAEIKGALKDLDVEVIGALRWGYPRVGAIHLDGLGSKVLPSFAYSTVFCCRVK